MSAVFQSTSPTHQKWARPGLQTAALALIVLLALWPTANSMVEIWWRSGTFNHAFAVPPLVAWLIWRSRQRWLHLQPRADRRWWPVLPLLAGIVVFSEAALANAPAHFALVGLLVALVPSMLGMKVMRAWAFPLLFAFFMVPFGEFLMPQMMEATATFTVWALQRSGVPVYREGLNFVIPSGQWSVVEACSGIRYLIASASVGTLFGYLTYSSPRKRWTFVAVALLVPVVANWIRAYMIVMLGHLSNNQLAAGADHLVYGWVFFGAIMAVMFAIGSRWADPHLSLASRTSSAPPPGLASRTLTTHADATRSAWGCAVLALLPVMLVWALGIAAPSAVPAQAPPSVSGWKPPQVVNLKDSIWRPVFIGASQESMWRYEPDGAVLAHESRSASVGLHLADYWNQDQERKLLSSENRLLSSGHPIWHQQGGTVPRLLVQVAGRNLNLQPQVMQARSGAAGNATSDRRTPSRLVAVQMVLIGGRWLVPDAWARVAMAWQRLVGGGDQAVSWVVFTEAGPALEAGKPDTELDDALKRLMSFVQSATAEAM